MRIEQGNKTVEDYGYDQFLSRVIAEKIAVANYIRKGSVAGGDLKGLYPRPTVDWSSGTTTYDDVYQKSIPMIILTKSSTVNQNVGGSNGAEVWWAWDGEDKKDTGFTHSTSTNSERVQVDADGWYHIRFLGNAQQTGGDRSTLHGIIRVNGGDTERKGSIRSYSRGSSYGNLSPGLECVMELEDGDYIELGTRVEDTDGIYTINTNGAEIEDDENLLIIKKMKVI